MIPGSLQQSNKGVNSLRWDIVKEKPGIWGTADFVKNGFVDLINTTKDTTDYLWHTTRFVLVRIKNILTAHVDQLKGIRIKDSHAYA